MSAPTLISLNVASAAGAKASKAAAAGSGDETGAQEAGSPASLSVGDFASIVHAAGSPAAKSKPAKEGPEPSSSSSSAPANATSVPPQGVTSDGTLQSMLQALAAVPAITAAAPAVPVAAAIASALVEGLESSSSAGDAGTTVNTTLSATTAEPAASTNPSVLPSFVSAPATTAPSPPPAATMAAVVPAAVSQVAGTTMPMALMADAADSADKAVAASGTGTAQVALQPLTAPLEVPLSMVQAAAPLAVEVLEAAPGGLKPDQAGGRPSQARPGFSGISIQFMPAAPAGGATPTGPTTRLLNTLAQSLTDTPVPAAAAGAADAPASSSFASLLQQINGGLPRGEGGTATLPQPNDSTAGPQLLAAAPDAALQMTTVNAAAPDSTPAGTPTATGTHTPLDTTQPTWTDALGGRVVSLLGQGLQEARIELHPRDMGSISVHIRLGNDGADVRFAATNPNVRDAIESSMPRLKEMLAGSGLQLAQSQVGSQMQQQDSSGRSLSQPPSPSSASTPSARSNAEPGAPAPAAPRAKAAPLSIIDDYA